MSHKIYLEIILFVTLQAISFALINGQDDDTYVLQKGRTRRLLWLNKKRELTLPTGTSLSITPMLAFPLLKQSSNWVAFENFQFQWTFFILFQGLGWTSDDNAWPIDVSFLLPNMSTTSEQSALKRSIDICRLDHKIKFLNSECSQQTVPVMAFPSHSPGGERANLLTKLESFLDIFGVNGRACLLRATCEVHEVSLKNGFGLLGEALTLFFSISQSTYSRSILPSYLKAEEAGKYGDCSNYYRKCTYSMFTSR